MDVPLDYLEDWVRRNMDINRCTCLNCDWQTNNCPYKFDINNVDGDCLMEK